MRLTKVHVTNFQSVEDSTEFDINDVTCLVGKNEAGKTAILKALYRLNPLEETEGEFDDTDDYPRRRVSDYKDEVSQGLRDQAVVVKTSFVLENDEIAAVEELFGPGFFSDEAPELVLQKGYSNELVYSLPNYNEELALKTLVKNTDLPDSVSSTLLEHSTAEDMMGVLENAERTEGVQELIPTIQSISDEGMSSYIFDDILYQHIPKFLYFDDYYQLTGRENIEELQQRNADNRLMGSDRPLLGLLELAGLRLDQLTNPQRTEALIAKLEAAENQLTQRVLTHWSQNRHLRMKFDIRPAQPGDPTGMTTGTNIWGRVQDTIHMVSTPMGTRSRGFVWFFSFLAWYSTQKDQNLILLLDEPGLSLHAKAQSDLLAYFERELKPNHQLIYTTHSPFMVDPTRFDRVRIVQDLSIDADFEDLSEDQYGTKVITEVLDATPDSLFPLQGALGYEIHQTLFIGPNCLVVEGVSDLLYLQTISSLLQRRGESGLSDEWVITPVGGSDKVPTFVALIGAQNLNLAVLVDYQKKDKQSIENIYKRKLLERNRVLTFAHFVSTEFTNNEADVEDMFEVSLYLKLVNGEFATNISEDDLPEGQARVLSRLERYFKKNPLPCEVKFNHYRPARYLSENIAEFDALITDTELDRFRRIFATLNGFLV
ncbi:MAG: AAA family ATPase [Gemmatimonadetes bacterium]|nr:AAA family ATPase [Gemmatimonadota bacterium]